MEKRERKIGSIRFRFVSDFFFLFLFFPFSIEKLALEMVCPGTGEGIEGICAWDSRKNIEIYVVLA